MNSVVYITTNLVNGKKYIGSTSNNFNYYLGGGKLLQLAIKKYGKPNFKKQILWEGDSQYRYEMEEYYINYYNAANNPWFYNISDKGVGNKIGIGGHHQPHTKQGKQNISKALKGRKNTWAKKQPILQSKNGKLVKRWDSIAEAKTQYKGVANVLSNRAKTAGGFNWDYEH